MADAHARHNFHFVRGPRVQRIHLCGASDGFNRTQGGGALGRADSGQFWGNASGSAWSTCSSAYACPIVPIGDESWTRLETNLTNQHIVVTLPAR